ncbi:MAG: ABC transporter ATP-binding protein [Clostridiaceae bacterium]|nr:ABC transporter ATP-binding protein [Clostridiaceae bacterium]
MNSLISFEKVSREYGSGDSKVFALRDISFDIRKGEFVVILGPSGAGKSTLLNILGGMDQASSGRVCFGDEIVSEYNDSQLTSYRAKRIGFVFQFYNLIPNLTAYENVSLTREINDTSLDPDMTLSDVGLEGRRDHFPAQMSGGEQQRVAIARALNKSPELLLCDEPTGALDSETGVHILSLLQRLSAEQGRTVIVVTHNSKLTQLAGRVIYLRDGQIEKDEINDHPIDAKEVRW